MEINQDNLDRLPELVSEVHDKWFSVERMFFNEAANEFKLFFGSKQNSYDQYLKVEGVTSCYIKDTEKIGIYDINYLSVDPRKNEVYIFGCIPIQITLKVNPKFKITTSSAVRLR